MGTRSLEVCACSIKLLLAEGGAVISYLLSGTLSESLFGSVSKSPPP